jgi:heat shock protein HslJ
MDTRILALLFLAAICLCGGCSDTAGRVPPCDICAYSWHLVSYNHEGEFSPLLPGTEITMRFLEDGTVAGSAGCNDYSSDYELDGNLMTFGPISMTEKYCLEPPGAMEQEQEFLALLSQSTRYTITEDSLVLSHYDARKLLVFEPGE